MRRGKLIAGLSELCFAGAAPLRGWSARLMRLLASMRFAIAILVVVALASGIGSILPQEQPLSVYLLRYGEAWGRAFVFAGLDGVYHAVWFIILLALLAISTTVCLYRNTPTMIRLAFAFQTNVNARYLGSLKHSTRLAMLRGDGSDEAVRSLLASHHFRVRTVRRGESDVERLYAGRKGAMRRIGYILTHGAIVLICIAAIGNGDTFVRARLLMGRERLETRDLPLSQVPAASVLPVSTQSFRAQVTVPEHDSVSAALVQFGGGYLVQPLPFNLRVRSFHIEYYPNGQPRDFVSDIALTDRDGTHARRYLVRVNHPVTDHDVTLYQSGFEDGGTRVRIRLDAISGQNAAVEATVGASAPVLINGLPWTLEPTSFTRVNVQRHADGNRPAIVDRFLHNSALTQRDLGPSIALTLRDMSGQSVDWLAFFSPIEINGASYRVVGVRRRGAADYDFIKIPADRDGSTRSFDALAHQIQNPALRARAVEALAVGVSGSAANSSSVAGAANAILDAFAANGYDGVAQMIQRAVPEKDRPRAASLFIAMLEQCGAQMPGIADIAERGVPSDMGAHVSDMMQAYSDLRRLDAAFIPIPLGYEQRNASGFQVTRQWGGGAVVTGFVLLALGVFLLYFVPERRVWVQVGADGRHLLIAMTANRATPSLAPEFESLVLGLARAERRPLRRSL